MHNRIIFYSFQLSVLDHPALRKKKRKLFALDLLWLMAMLSFTKVLQNLDTLPGITVVTLPMASREVFKTQGFTLSLVYITYSIQCFLNLQFLFQFLNNHELLKLKSYEIFLEYFSILVIISWRKRNGCIILNGQRQQKKL